MEKDVIDRLVRAKEFANILGISKSTLYNWITYGRLPEPIQLGPRIQVWPLSQVNELVEKMKADSLIAV